MTKFSDVAHLYLNCLIQTSEGVGRLSEIHSEGENPVVSYDLVICDLDFHDFKPILRRLQSLTEEECKQCELEDVQIGLIMYGSHQQVYLTTKQFTWLLSKYFDLHNLIDSQQAIEAVDLTKPGEQLLGNLS